MLATRPFFARTAPLRLFHSSISPHKDVRTVELEAVEPPDLIDPLARELDATPSTHRGAAVTPGAATEPHEIFNAWDFNTFYSPLAFLRSRRMKLPPGRRKRPTVGPGAIQAAHTDVFRQLDINPVHEANNQLLLSAFITSMGKIATRAETGLSWRSQRKVAQAIKRSKQKGVMPILSRPRYYIPKKSANDK